MKCPECGSWNVEANVEAHDKSNDLMWCKECWNSFPRCEGRD